MPSGEHSRDVGFEVAYLPEVGFECVGWCVSDEDAEGNDMENGWIRYDTHESFNPTIIFDVYLSDGRESWLTQANYIFSSLQIASKLENHVLVTAIHFELIGPKQTVDSGCPPGYLFLCPEQHFQVGTSSFKWPDNPAYWSLDPSGVERLSMEEATQLGFPRFTLTTEVHGVSWDTSVYAGLRQFHQAKGFDPESQDVARHLGLPLYQLSGNIDPPFAHVEEDENRGGDEGGEDVNDDAASHEGNDSPSHGTPVDERDDTEDLALVAEGEDCDLLPGDADTEPRSMSPVPGAASK
ncbi:hypothetical protein C8R46DRAFT_240071 [Mycena filopes]|nr:hypothetical protein C8R46DRAFT_240071 [Mycena filopes]